MLVASVLSVFTRIGTKLWIFRKLTVDDILGIVAMAFCIAETIAISIATENGLGQHMNSLSQVNKIKMMKVSDEIEPPTKRRLSVESKLLIKIAIQSQYAADLLFIASMCFSKLAIIFFIRYLSPASFDRQFSLGLAIFIVLWTVSGVLVSSFECRVPLTWNYINGKCFHLVCEVILSDYNVLTPSRWLGGHIWGLPTFCPRLALSHKHLWSSHECKPVQTRRLF